MKSFKMVPFRGKLPGKVAPGIFISPAAAKDKDVVRYLCARGIRVYRRLSDAGDLISHMSGAAPDASGEVYLLPGVSNAYGPGVYFGNVNESKWHRAARAGDHNYIISLRQAKAAGADITEKTWFLCRTGIRLRVVESVKRDETTDHYCVVVEVLDQATTDFARKPVMEEHGGLSNPTRVTRRLIRRAKRESAPAVTSFRYMLAGKLLAIVCFCIWACRVRKTSIAWKWYGLGHFLMGFGGKLYIPAHIAASWRSGVVEQTGDGKLFIRPSADTALFWLVGGMTVERTEDGYYGEDVYDFHPQKGQNTIKGGSPWLCWAWSGGQEDGTRVPSKVFGIDLLAVIGKLLPELPGLFVREEGGYLLFSNNLWNKLGGRPFVSILRVRD